MNTLNLPFEIIYAIYTFLDTDQVYRFISNNLNHPRILLFYSILPPISYIIIRQNISMLTVFKPRLNFNTQDVGSLPISCYPPFDLLSLAIQKCSIKITKFIINTGTKIVHEHALTAVKLNRINMLKLLVSNYGVSIITPLVVEWAATNGNIKIIKYLLYLDVSFDDYAIEWGVNSSNVTVVELLLDSREFKRNPKLTIVECMKFAIATKNTKMINVFKTRLNIDFNK